jgi:hypothetical protein
MLRCRWWWSLCVSVWGEPSSPPLDNPYRFFFTGTGGFFRGGFGFAAGFTAGCGFNDWLGFAGSALLVRISTGP